MLKVHIASGRAGWLVLAALLIFLSAGPLVAQNSRNNSDAEEGEPEQTQPLDPRVAADLLSAYELLEEDENEQALEELNRLIDRRGDSMKDFDKASVLQIRGTTHVNLNNMDSALEDYAAALRLDALPEEQENRLRFNMAQLNFIDERYEEAIRLFEQWMQADVEVTHLAYFMLGASYYYLDQNQRALEPIRQAIEKAPEPDRRYYELLNIVYSRLGMLPERARLLEEMVGFWPDRLNFWKQLSSVYLEQDEQFKSFAALEAAYVNGLLESESDLVVLAQYYSTFDNPHRGARLLEREMEDGRVERTVDHLELLSQLWSQAREHGKAIPVLREAARKSDEGVLSFRLGQSLLADENYGDAESALETALEKGGLDDSMTAQAWMLLGTARFNQADPGDREQREDADRAFARAEQFSSTRQQASDWRNYISAINQTEQRQVALEREESEVLASAARDRLITACRARQLAGSELSERCRALLDEVERDEDSDQ